MPWLTKLKDYWWVAVAFLGLSTWIATFRSLPVRVDKVEAGQAQQEDRLVDVEKFTERLDGYLQGQAQLNERLAVQPAPMAAMPPLQPIPSPV